MRIFLLNKKKLIFIFILLISYCVFIVEAFGGYDGMVTALAPKKKLPIYCVDRQEKIASLSFDAAWGNEDTEQLIAILAKYNVKATFFVVGEWVDKYPQSVKALSDAGHEIMNHSDTHAHMAKISREEVIKEIKTCNDKIEQITKKRPILFRPPYGEYNNALIETVQQESMYTIQWDVDSHDWMNKSVDYIVKRVTSKVKNGSIVLFHNAAKNTPASLPAIIEKLQADGFSLVPISEIIIKDNYTIDHAGKQIRTPN